MEAKSNVVRPPPINFKQLTLGFISSEIAKLETLVCCHEENVRAQQEGIPSPYNMPTSSSIAMLQRWKPELHLLKRMRTYVKGHLT